MVRRLFTAERLDVILAQFRVVVTKRPKLACRACPGVVLQEPAPARLAEGGMPTEATVAHVHTRSLSAAAIGKSRKFSLSFTLPQSCRQVVLSL